MIGCNKIHHYLCNILLFLFFCSFLFNIREKSQIKNNSSYARLWFVVKKTSNHGTIFVNSKQNTLLSIVWKEHLHPNFCNYHKIFSRLNQVKVLAFYFERWTYSVGNGFGFLVMQDQTYKLIVHFCQDLRIFAALS